MSFAQSASELIALGCAVGPLHTVSGKGTCSCPKGAACEAAGKHPRTKNGVKDFSADPAVVGAWAKRWRASNVGVATGAISGLVVIDVDPRSHGDENIAALEREIGALPHTPRVLTGGGGWHLYFKYPGPCVGKAGEGVDVQGDRKYVVAPLSTHRSGRLYTFDVGAHPLETELAELPPAWIERLRDTRHAKPLGPAVGPVGESFIARAFAYVGWLGPEKSGGRAMVRCPWAHEHTDDRGRGADDSTVIFAPTEASPIGGFKCRHHHCTERTYRDVLREGLPDDAILATYNILPELTPRVARVRAA